ncbi:HNH endonuclease signature motif containing protein [Microbacterium sp. GXF7504]
MTISVPPPAPGITGMLREALATLTDPASLARLSDEDLIDATREAESPGRLVDAARVFAAGELADRSRRSLGMEGLAARLGCRNAAELLERALLVSGRTARDRIATAEPLRDLVSITGEVLPGRFRAVRSALTGGMLSLDAATAIARTLSPAAERGADPGAIDAAVGELVASAIGRPPTSADDAEPPCTADEVRIMAQTWALVLDPDGALPDEAKGLRRRGLTLGRLREGTVPLRGELLPDVAAQLQRLIDAYLNPRVDDAGTGPTFRDDELVEDHEHRSSTQQRHDALAGILTVAATHHDTPTLGGAAPTLVVAVTADELERGNGTAFVQGADDDRTAVPASVARHTGCAGAVQRVVQAPDGRILSLGLPQRTFSAHQRRAITLRDGACVIPGCHVPATWCEVHHVQEAARGGPTHTDNGVLLCWFHHRTIDTGGWRIEMRAGEPWVSAPGWVDPHRRWQRARSPLGRWRRQRA